MGKVGELGFCFVPVLDFDVVALVEVAASSLNREAGKVGRIPYNSRNF
jgi:hypothetical protein